MKPDRVDWVAIEREYRAGVISIRAIAAKYDLSDAAIRKKAKNELWERDLATAVREKVRANLVRKQVREHNAEDDAEAIEAAAAVGVAVIESHRGDIRRLRELEQKLLTELENNPTKLYIAQYQGNIIEKEVGIAVTDRASALQALAGVQHKRIQLERQAFNLDDVDRNASKCLIEMDL